MRESEYTIAIIGMAGKFPCSDDVDQFWQNLKVGKNCITRDPSADKPGYVAAYGKLDDIAGFDAGFFGISPAEANDSDPEMRVMLELTQHALENAGYAAPEKSHKTGIYTSFGNGVYIWNYIMQSGSNWYENYEIYKAYLSTRCEKIAYKFGFEGPAIMSEYACASSLNAVHQACQSLLNFECDMALAGGVSVDMKQEGYPASLATTSSKGVMRSFDKDSDGLVPGSGAGLVVLRRYEDAVNDHDNIIAVIKGTYVNNDGNRKAGFAAPGVFGQTDCLRSVLSVSDVSADDIDYYETHGTATELGDSIELTAISGVIGKRDSDNKLYIGSVKPNIGHTNMAAGIANVIKTALILQNRTIVPTINYQNPCSSIESAGGALEVADKVMNFSKDKQMTAVCSAVGMGGANAMAVLAEYIPENERSSVKNELSQLLVFSGKTREAVTKIREKTIDLVKRDGLRLDDTAYTLQNGRDEYEYRAYEICGSGSENELRRVHHIGDGASRRIVFVFSGAGSFDRTIGKELYNTYPVFKKYMDQCFECCERNGISDIKKTYLDFEVSDPESADNIKGIELIFAIGYSLAKTYMELGICPDTIVGHSNGEYIAAVVSGIMSMDDAVKLLKARAELMEKLPEGAMINIAAPEDKVTEMLEDGVSIGAVNAPGRIMVTGRRDAMDKFEEKLKAAEMMYSSMRVNRASHCSIMQDISEEYLEMLNKVSFSKPKMKIVSTCDVEQDSSVMTSPDYWIKQMCEPVRFCDAVRKIENEEESLFIEMGTSDTLASMIRKIRTESGFAPAIASFDSPTAENARDGFLAALGEIWCCGITPDWDKLYDEKPYKVQLANYPFEHKEYWKFNENIFSSSYSAKEVGNVLICDGLDENTFAKTRYIAGRTEGNIIIAEPATEQYNNNSKLTSAFDEIRALWSNIRENEFGDSDVLLLRDVDGFIEDSDKLSAACIMDYFRMQPDFSVDDVFTKEKLIAFTGTIEKYVPFIEYFVSFLNDYNYISYEYGMITFNEKAKNLSDKNTLLAEFSKKYPDQCAYLEFCVYASDHYDEVFRGNREGSTVIYPDGKFDLIYSYESRMKKYTYTEKCIRALGKTVRRIADSAGRKLRILEIGAGSGEMTDTILEQLDGLEYEYWFTDLKLSLVNERKNSPDKDNRNMRFAAMDIAKSPAEQGFTENSFDVVILYDVIQATENISRTLKNISSLIADNGIFAFVQTCDGIELLNLIFGYAPGWWNYSKDPERNRITMPPEKWREKLIASGFSNVASLPDDKESNAYRFIMQKKAESNADERIFCSDDKNKRFEILKKECSDISVSFLDDLSEENINSEAKKLRCDTIIMNKEDESASDENDNGARDDLDAKLFDIVKEVIGADVSIDDNLYELGMDSLMAMMISSKIQKELGYNMQLSDMYDTSSVREISDFLRGIAKTDSVVEEENETSEPMKTLDDLFADL